MSHIAAAGELLSAASYMSKRNFSGIGGVLTALMTSAAFFASPQAFAQSTPAQGVTIPSVTVTAPDAQRRTNPASAVRRSSGMRSAGRKRHGGRRRPPRHSPSCHRRTPAPAPSAITPTAPRSRPRPTRRWSTFRSRSPSSPRSFIQRPELPGPHRRHALRAGRRRPPGRRQSRRTRHPRRRFQRELLRQRLSRRRAIFPRSLQHPEHRGAEGAERADLRPRRRRRPRSTARSRRPTGTPDLRGDGADRLVRRPARHARCRAGHQRERRGAPQRVLRGQRHVPRLRPSRALRHQSDSDAEARRHHQDQAQLRILPRRPHGRSRQSLAGPYRGAVITRFNPADAVRARTAT